MISSAVKFAPNNEKEAPQLNQNMSKEDGARVVGGLRRTSSIYFVRHEAVRMLVSEPIFYGGRAEVVSENKIAEEYALRLRDLVPTTAHWACSSLSRARCTYWQINKLAGPFTFENIKKPWELNEMDFGLLEGRKIKDLLAEYGGNYYAFAKEYQTKRTPKGESFSDVKRRAKRVFNELKDRDATVIIGHRNWFQAAMVSVLGASPEFALRTEIDNLGISRIDYLQGEDESGSSWILRYLNRSV